MILWCWLQTACCWQHQVLRMRIARKYLLIQTILLPLQPRNMAAAGTFGNNNSPMNPMRPIRPMNLMRPKPLTPLQKRGAFCFLTNCNELRHLWFYFIVNLRVNLTIFKRELILCSNLLAVTEKESTFAPNFQIYDTHYI